MSVSRTETLAVLQGRPISRLPVFSGLPCLTSAGLAASGIRYNDAHTDSARMAAAAASTFRVCGFESAVVPFDLCIEAEALGCHVDFQTDLDIVMPPVVDRPLFTSDRHGIFAEDHSHSGRIPVVQDAIRKLKAGVGAEIAIGAWIPGPYTLAWQLFGADAWLSATQNESEVEEILSASTDFLARVAQSYSLAGADFLTIHEMGGSPQVIGPDAFRGLVLPALTRLFASLRSPSVLSVCGDTNAIIPDVAECGAGAFNFDHRNDIARTRRLLPDAVLLGNLDPVGELCNGTPHSVNRAVERAARAGVNAVWPGCDLQPDIPPENLRALMGSRIT